MSVLTTNPYISVIVPMYNVERYIEMCINSILGQTFQDFEIIVVDDCSSDNCYEIVNRVYGNNDKIKILWHKTNHGLGSARNSSIEIARGEYIIFVDSDDLLFPEALEKFCEAAEATNADVIHASDRYELYEDKNYPNALTKATLKIFWDNNNQAGLFLIPLKQMTRFINLKTLQVFDDGHASERIVNVIQSIILPH